MNEYRRRRLRFIAFRKGIIGSSGTWFAIWVLILVGRTLHRIFGRNPKVVYTATLDPGQSLVIAHGREAGAVQVPE